MNSVIPLEQLATDFAGMFTRRAFRLETLDYYVAANERESYARYLAGLPVDPAWRKPWASLVHGVRESGREMARVHVVSEPASEYVRFSLLHGYPASVAAGEDVRILGRRQAVRAGLPDFDYWLFDDGPAVRLDYDHGGNMTRAWQDDGPWVPWYCQWRDTALRLAVPLAQYVAEHDISDERNRHERVG